jgi:hypothetical protein
LYRKEGINKRFGGQEPELLVSQETLLVKMAALSMKVDTQELGGKELKILFSLRGMGVLFPVLFHILQ